jgi:hypothetical protein
VPTPEVRCSKLGIAAPLSGTPRELSLPRSPLFPAQIRYPFFPPDDMWRKPNTSKTSSSPPEMLTQPLVGSRPFW